MAVCGDRFIGLAVTSLGATPTEPLTGFSKWSGAGPIDAKTWQALASDLYDRASADMKHLGDIETARGKGFAEWNALVKDHHRAWEMFDKINFWIELPTDTVQKSKESVLESICLIEKIDDALKRLGEAGVSPERELPKTEKPTTWSDWILPAVVVAGIVFLLYKDLSSSSGGSKELDAGDG